MSKRKEGEAFTAYKERLKLENAYLNTYLQGKFIHISIEGERYVKDKLGIVHRRYGKTYRKELQ